jgi:hypothetical protein
MAGSGQLRNISISGAYIVSALPVALMGRVRVRMKATETQRRPRESLEARVVRSDPDGFAVEWCEFAPPLARALIRDARTEILDTRLAMTVPLNTKLREPITR